MEMVSIPRKEYRQLLRDSEHLSQIRAEGRRKARDKIALPEEFRKRILAGEHPVRVLRCWRGMRPADLARASGVHKVVIHNLETGKSKGSLDTLMKIAAALYVTVYDIQ
jgi:transcriptional regulator with XRE-family HTH domain